MALIFRSQQSTPLTADDYDNNLLTLLELAQDRSGHTGTQLASTISDLETAVGALPVISGPGGILAKLALLDGLDSVVDIGLVVDNIHPPLTANSGQLDSISVGVNQVLTIQEANSETTGLLTSQDWQDFQSRVTTGLNFSTPDTLSIYESKQGTTLRFRPVKAGSNMSLTIEDNAIVFNNTLIEKNTAIFKKLGLTYLNIGSLILLQEFTRPGYIKSITFIVSQAFDINTGVQIYNTSDTLLDELQFTSSINSIYEIQTYYPTNNADRIKVLLTTSGAPTTGTVDVVLEYIELAEE